MIKKKGFTFVELLVSVSIIIVLSMVAIVSYQTANRKARDSKRKADLEQIRAALEMYRTDNDQYPVDETGNCWDSLNRTLVDGNYINEIPTDPLPIRRYNCRSDATSYRLCAYLEGEDPDECGDLWCGTPGVPIQCNYQVTNP